jgi:asparagine synthase (glutamine-hydrolysing)
MCGIVAMMDYYGARVEREELLRIREAMAARGPDGAGLWISPDAGVGLAHRRLSLVDLSETGSQPMANADGSLTIVFNGEIYNYRDLRRRLEQKGFAFQSTSDTEVLLHLYACKGEAMLNELRGMYAFVIWDQRRRRLVAARDPFGIKPLYIADDGRCVRIASQVKALLAGGRINSARDPAGQVGFLLWGYVPEPFTLYRSIASCPAGAAITIDADGARSTRYFCRVSDELVRLEQDAPARTSTEDLGPSVRAALSDSVRHHLIADVPVGVFLSAGLDSTALTALAAEQSQRRLCTVTLGFDEYRGTKHDETAYARLIADGCNTDHHTRWFGRDQFETEMSSIVAAMDQPSIDGINTYFVSKAARASAVKTALSGLGGDELFGTYPSFTDVPRMVRMCAAAGHIKTVGCWIRRLASPIVGRFTSTKYAGLFEYGGSFAGAYMLRRGLFMPWEMTRFLSPECVREGWERLAPLERLEETIAGIRSARLAVSALEMTWYMRNQLLRDSDWAGMAHSVEIRVPMVDIEVLRALTPLLANRPLEGKGILAGVAAPRLRGELLKRPKTGFAVPVHRWVPAHRARRATLRAGLRNWAAHLTQAFALAC